MPQKNRPIKSLETIDKSTFKRGAYSRNTTRFVSKRSTGPFLLAVRRVAPSAPTHFRFLRCSFNLMLAHHSAESTRFVSKRSTGPFLLAVRRFAPSAPTHFRFLTVTSLQLLRLVTQIKNTQPKLCVFYLVPIRGIEPRTQGFSVLKNMVYLVFSGIF